ncbi:hypothetical protein RND81_05G084200 [Saponaria officinalis]|uniref:Endonuclease/exonuclease/phosphatase n=1 Tax=Saponaria officinalis TaxID=3572 RepID=A0AAW1KZ34_SAPOF
MDLELPWIMDDCALHDMGFRGNKFTWQRDREIGLFVGERLDRAMSTTEWNSLFPHAEVRNLPICYSDHAAIIVNINQPQWGRQRRKFFEFEPFWLSDPKCSEVVDNAWRDHTTEGVEKKIKNCALRL